MGGDYRAMNNEGVNHLQTMSFMFAFNVKAILRSAASGMEKDVCIYNLV